MGNSRAWPISFNLDLPLCCHRCESPFYNVVRIVLPAVGGNISDTRLLRPLPAQHQDKHMRRKQVPSSSNKYPHVYTSLMFIQPPPHYFHSFHHPILQPRPLLPLPCPSLSISISYLLLPSSSFPLSCHPPVGSYPGRMQLLLNGSSTECNCFVNNSTGTR